MAITISKVRWWNSSNRIPYCKYVNSKKTKKNWFRCDTALYASCVLCMIYMPYNTLLYDLYFIIHGVFNNFFSKFGVKGALNFDRGPKSDPETCHTGVKILVKSKLLVLALSNLA